MEVSVPRSKLAKTLADIIQNMGAFMLTLGHSTKHFMCRKPVDFRYGFNGLANLCKKLASGSVFLFFNRAMNKVKIIYYDGTGSVMIWKRLEKGKYKLPRVDEKGEFQLSRLQKFKAII